RMSEGLVVASCGLNWANWRKSPVSATTVVHWRRASSWFMACVSPEERRPRHAGDRRAGRSMGMVNGLRGEADMRGIGGRYVFLMKGALLCRPRPQRAVAEHPLCPVQLPSPVHAEPVEARHPAST